MIKKILNGEAKAVSRIYKGVKSECRLELDGRTRWSTFMSGTTVGAYVTSILSAKINKAAHYSNYFGFSAKGSLDKFIRVGYGNDLLYIQWHKGAPPVGYEHWEKDGDVDKSAINADLAKKHLIIWYDNTDSSVGNMSALIPLIARDVAKVKKVIDGTAADVFAHVASEVADGVVEVSPAEVADGMLTIKGDNVKVENNKLIIK